MPDYSRALCCWHGALSVTIPARPNHAGLHLLIDSTSAKRLGDGEWTTKKHGANYQLPATSYQRQWRNSHLGIDAQTLEGRAIEITANQRHW